jgi:phenylacetate-CoA ligase
LNLYYFGEKHDKEMFNKMKETIYTLILHLKGIYFKQEYKEIKKIKNVNDLKTFQEKNLKKLILHVYKNVPYYRGIFEKINIINNNNVDLSKFHDIPILTKKNVNEHLKDLTSSDYNTRKWEYNFSGGSTGEPTRFIQDIHYNRWVNATNHFYYNDMLGINDIHCKKIILWGSPQDLFKGNVGIKAKIGIWLSNTIFLNSFKMSESDMIKYLQTINHCKPDLLRGYAGSLFELCRFAERKNIKINSQKILISSAETLTNDMREKIETVFGTKVNDFYGSRETASIAGECRNRSMHIFSFNNYIEIVDKNSKPVKEGEDGRIIVTNLHNYSMPFLRYEIGDMAKLGSTDCICENFLPTLKKIYGREEQQFITKDGKIVIGYYFVHLIGVVLNKGYIKKFQVIQEDYEKIKILAVLDKGLPVSERKEIEQKIKLQMGEECRVLWEFVDDIPIMKSGKFLYTKSFVKKY